MTGHQQARMARVLAVLTLVVVVAIGAGVLYLGPQILSSRDAADLTACRAEYAAAVNDARWSAVFSLIRADHPVSGEELEELLAPIERANRVYREAITDSRTAPEAFLRRCRGE